MLIELKESHCSQFVTQILHNSKESDLTFLKYPEPQTGKCCRLFRLVTFIISSKTQISCSQFNAVLRVFSVPMRLTAP